VTFSAWPLKCHRLLPVLLVRTAVPRLTAVRTPAIRRASPQMQAYLGALPARVQPLSVSRTIRPFTAQTRSATLQFPERAGSHQQYTRRNLSVSAAGEISLFFFSSHFIIRSLISPPFVQEKLKGGTLEDILENDERDISPLYLQHKHYSFEE